MPLPIGDNNIYIAQIYDYLSKTSGNIQFISSYKDFIDDNKQYPSQISAQMFSAIQLIVEAIQKITYTDNLSDLRRALNTQLRSGQRFDTPLGTIFIDQHGEAHHSDASVIVVEIEKKPNGEGRLKRSY